VHQDERAEDQQRDAEADLDELHEDLLTLRLTGPPRLLQ
jgi:hypothetical protein